MRIDTNQPAPQLAENERTSNSKSANREGSSAASSPLGEDQAQLSGIHAHVQALAAQLSQLPEIRQEKVNALRQAVLGGTYQPAPQQVADAVFAHMVATPAA